MSLKTEQQKLANMNEGGKTDWGKGEPEPQESLRDLWDYNTRSNICAIEMSRGEEKDGRADRVLQERICNYS